VRRLIRVRGVVQGVGFRPFVHHLATLVGLDGTVCNDPEGVLIDATGPVEVLDEFQRRLMSDAPALAQVHSLEVEQRPTPDTAPTQPTASASSRPSKVTPTRAGRTRRA